MLLDVVRKMKDNTLHKMFLSLWMGRRFTEIKALGRSIKTGVRVIPLPMRWGTVMTVISVSASLLFRGLCE